MMLFPQFHLKTSPLMILNIVIALLFLGGCSNDAPSQTAGGWTETENGIQARITDSQGKALQTGFMLSILQTQWIADIQEKHDPHFDTTQIINGQLNKIWNDTLPRIIRIQSDSLQFFISNSRDASQLKNISLLKPVIISGYTNQGFDSVRVLGLDTKDGIDGNQFYVLSSLPPGIHTFLLQKNDSLIWGGTTLIESNIQTQSYNIFACSDNPRWNPQQLSPQSWTFFNLKPTDTLSTMQNSLLLSGVKEDFTYKLNNEIYFQAKTDSTIQLSIPMGLSSWRFFNPQSNDACLTLYLK